MPVANSIHPLTLTTMSSTLFRHRRLRQHRGGGVCMLSVGTTASCALGRRHATLLMLSTFSMVADVTVSLERSSARPVWLRPIARCIST